MAREWFLKHEGKEYGPYTDGQLITLASDGSIATATPLRQGPSANWVQAGTVPGLFGNALQTSGAAAPATKDIWQAQPVVEAIPPQSRAAIMTPNSPPLVTGSRRATLRAKKRSGLPLVVGVLGCALLATATYAFLKSRGIASNVATTTGTATTSLEGKWVSEGVYLSTKFAEPAIMTIRGRGGEWRDIRTQAVRELTSVVSQNDGTVKIVIDDTTWEAKLLPSGELQFRQPGEPVERFPNLKSYSDTVALDNQLAQREQEKLRRATHKMGTTSFVCLGTLDDDRATNTHLLRFLMLQELTSLETLTSAVEGDYMGEVAELEEGIFVRSLKTKVKSQSQTIWQVHFVEILSGTHVGKTGWICDRVLLRN